MDDWASDLSDEDLLARLAESFSIEDIEPDASTLRQLSIAVAALHQPEPPRLPRVTLQRRLRPAVLAGTVLGALVAGTGISYAVGVPIPAAVRSIARTVGLAKAPPVSTSQATATPPPTTAVSPVVQRARQAESTLHQALASGHSSPATISHDSAALAHKLAQVGQLHATGAVGASNDGHHLLDQACRQLTGEPTASKGATVPSQVTCAAAGIGVHSPGSTSSSSPGASTPAFGQSSGGDNQRTTGKAPGSSVTTVPTGRSTPQTPETSLPTSPVRPTGNSSGDPSGHAVTKDQLPG